MKLHLYTVVYYLICNNIQLSVKLTLLRNEFWDAIYNSESKVVHVSK